MHVDVLILPFDIVYYIVCCYITFSIRILLELLLCVFSLCQFIQAWSCRTTVCNKLYLFLVAFNVPVYSLFCSFVSPAVGS